MVAEIEWGFIWIPIYEFCFDRRTTVGEDTELVLVFCHSEIVDQWVRHVYLIAFTPHKIYLVAEGRKKNNLSPKR